MGKETDELRTPDWLWEPLDDEFDFGVDVAADASNAKTDRYITAQQDALVTPWRCELIGPVAAWCNPPYSQPNVPRFLERAYRVSITEAITVVMLLQADPAQAWIDWVIGKAAEVRHYVPGRIRFDGPDGRPSAFSSTKPHCLVIYRPVSVLSTSIQYVLRPTAPRRGK